MSQKDLIKLVIAAVALLVGVGLIVARGGGPDRRGVPGPEAHFYYDLDTGELFTESVTRTPPITAPSGGEGVRAFVFTCGQCASSQLVIGYLQKLSGQAIEATDQLTNVDEDKRHPLYAQIQGGTFVAVAPEAGQPPRWLPAVSPESKAIIQSYLTICPGKKRALLCTPDKTDRR